MMATSVEDTNCWKEAGGKEPRSKSQSTGRSFKPKGAELADKKQVMGPMGKYEIMNFRGSNSQMKG